MYKDTLLKAVMVIFLCTSTVSDAFAKCAHHATASIVKEAEYLIHGQVLTSNYDRGRQDITQIGVRHHFEIKVLAVLKGQVAHENITFDYKFMNSKPPVKAFSAGDEFVFAVRVIEPMGKATILGVMCGRSGVDVHQIEVIKGLIKQKN